MRKKKNITTWLLVLLLFAGLSLLLYPIISDQWNGRHSTKAIASYDDSVATLDVDRYDALWQSAAEYNHALTQRSNSYVLSPEQAAWYDQQLNPTGSGIMGYVEIPSIQSSLPIYHGTDEAVLQIAIGHLEWTSLPVGGESTHCVLSGHRGLPSAKLFSELDKVTLGEQFMLHILDETLTYEVDQIRIVEPHETEDLLIVEGQDYCTLFTCTPYGVNTHRLLVRGHRVENTETTVVRLTADAVAVEPMIVAAFIAAPILLILLMGLLLPGGSRKHSRR